MCSVFLVPALVSSAANVQQSGLLFCAPPVGYQLAPTGLAVSHSDSSVIPMHRFLGPRDDLPHHSLHSSQVHQMTSSVSTRVHSFTWLQLIASCYGSTGNS